MKTHENRDNALPTSMANEREAELSTHRAAALPAVIDEKVPRAASASTKAHAKSRKWPSKRKIMVCCEVAREMSPNGTNWACRVEHDAIEIISRPPAVEAPANDPAPPTAPKGQRMAKDWN